MANWTNIKAPPPEALQAFVNNPDNSKINIIYWTATSDNGKSNIFRKRYRVKNEV